MSDQAIQVAGNGQFGNLAPQLGGSGLPPSLQILLNDGLYDRVKQLAGVMAKAHGFTPSHLLSKPEACFAIINIALDSRLNPHFVARHTYQTPGGQIGYDGALVQAILEQSGKFHGAPQMQYVGDWSKVFGKFEKKTSQKGNEYIARSWNDKDAAGLGVIVRWQMRGEDKPRVWPGEEDPFFLTQCYPLNSPLWATDPKTQIAYLAIRRFANLTSPGILGASAFEEGEFLDASDRSIDVTPRQEPRREDFVNSEQPEPEPKFQVVDLDGVVTGFVDPARAGRALQIILAEASRQGIGRLDAAWDDNDGLIATVDQKVAGELATEFADMRERLQETIRRDAERVAEMNRIEEEKRSEEQNPATNPVAGATPEAINQDEQGHAGTALAPSDGGGRTVGSIPATGVSEQTSQPSHPAPAGRAAERQSDALPPDAARGAAVAEPPRAGPPRSRAEPHQEETQEAERKSQYIAPPLKRGTDKPDYRAWAVALFLPKVRRMNNTNELAYLLGDNEPNLDACRGSLAPNDLSDIEVTIAAAWARCT